MVKIALIQESAVNILATSGPIGEQDVPVLKAGVAKLIRDGKNQLVIETAEQNVPDVLVRELMQLDLLARELAGRVVVVAPSSELRTKLVNFARPMTLEVFEARALATSFFEQINAAPLGPIPGVAPPGPASAPSTVAPESAVVAPVVPAPEAATVAVVAPVAAPAPHVAPAVSEAAVSAAEEQVIKLKAEIRAREQGEVGQLREAIARLESENKTLIDRLGTYLLERRKPANEAAYQARISELEEKVEKLLEELGQAESGKKDGKK